MVGPWGWRGMMGGNWLGGGFLALVSCLIFLAFVALVVWLIVRLVRSTTPGNSQVLAAPPPSPQVDPVLETLRRRLAEGAITEAEFDQLREKLGV